MASILDAAQRESPALFERLGGKPRRTCGDLDGLAADLGKALKDREPEIRLAAVHILGRLGREVEAYSGDAATTAEAAVSALSGALADRDAGVREEALLALVNFPTMTSPTLVDRVSRAAEDSEPPVRWACVAALRAFGSKSPLSVVAALLRIIAAPGTQDDDLLKTAIEGLADCGQDAASEAVDTLTVVVRDGRLAADTRVAACKVLGWLGPDAKSASNALVDLVVGGGARPVEAEVRLAATQALIDIAEWSLLATRAANDDQRRELLSLLRQVGPDATDARRNLQAVWRQAPPTSTVPSAPAQTGTAQVDLGAERLATLESTLARIEKGLKASQAASPEKRLYTVDEVAELTKLSAWTVRNACSKGRIKAEKGPNGQWRIPRDELVKIQNEGLPK